MPDRFIKQVRAGTTTTRTRPLPAAANATNSTAQPPRSSPAAFKPKQPGRRAGTAAHRFTAKSTFDTQPHSKPDTAIKRFAGMA
jgi:hypothetical protein